MIRSVMILGYLRSWNTEIMVVGSILVFCLIALMSLIKRPISALKDQRKSSAYGFNTSELKRIFHRDVRSDFLPKKKVYKKSRRTQNK